MFGNRNRACSEAQKNIVKTWLQEPSVQQWFKHEKLVSSVKEVNNVTLPELPF
jgi:hypothetical protein